jgi:hypothetical protein
MTNIKYAMVGTGLMADLILRDFALSESTELHALVSREPARAQAKLTELGIDAKALTFDQALIDPQVDVIYIVDTDRVEIEEIRVEKRGAGYVHMLEAVSTSVLAGEIENEKHPHSFTLEVMRELDEVRSPIS